MPENLTKQRKEINLNFDDPQLNLEDIAQGTIIIAGYRRDKELVTQEAHRREEISHWVYFETLERYEGGIKKIVYIGHAVNKKVYGIQVHDVSNYSESLLKQDNTNEKVDYELLDEALKEAGL